MKKFLKASIAAITVVAVMAGITVLLPDASDAGETITLPTIKVCSHSFIEKVDAKYLKSERDFKNGAIYYKSCSKCGAKKVTQTFEVGDPYIYGDADDDGWVDDTDMLLLIQYVANYDWDLEASTVDVKPGADANGDGVVDDTDMLLLIQYVANYDWDLEASTVVLGPEES